MQRYEQQLPQMEQQELVERTRKMFPCFVDENNMCFEAEKGDPFNETFLWNKTPLKYLGQFSGHHLFVDDGTGEGTFKTTHRCHKFITMHEYSYLFKPSLEEVARFLPKEIFEDNEKLYILTKGLYRDENSPFPVGTNNLHVAETFVFTPVQD
nr:hypothetical protein MarFTME_409 [Marseillevirus futianmevirus]